MRPLGPDKRPCCLCGDKEYVYTVQVSYMVGKGKKRQLQRNSAIALCTSCRMAWAASNEVVSPSKGRFCDLCVQRLGEVRAPVWNRLLNRSAVVKAEFTCCVCEQGGKREHYWTTDAQLAEFIRKFLSGED